jgi:hypothetical protein
MPSLDEASVLKNQKRESLFGKFWSPGFVRQCACSHRNQRKVISGHKRDCRIYFTFLIFKLGSSKLHVTQVAIKFQKLSA